MEPMTMIALGSLGLSAADSLFGAYGQNEAMKDQRKMMKDQMRTSKMNRLLALIDHANKANASATGRQRLYNLRNGISQTDMGAGMAPRV